MPGREGFETNHELAAIYGNGGDVAPIVPVVKLPAGKTVDSPGVTSELECGSREGQGRPAGGAGLASYASTRDRAFVSDDGRTTFALVYIPAKGGVDPGQAEARRAQAALAGVTVGGSPVEVTGLDALRAARKRERRRAPASCLETLAAALGALLDPRLRLPLVHGDRAAAHGGRRDPDDLPADLAARERHRRVGDRPVPRRADRARDRDRLRAARRRPLARGAAAAERDQRGGGAERDAARRLGRRLQRHDRRDLAARAARRAGAGPAQHRHRGPADRARQRRRRDHAAAGRPGDDRAEARLAPQPPRRPRQPRLVGVGPPRRPPPLARGRDVDRRPGRARRRRLDDPARQPARRLARPAGPARAGLEKLEDSGIGTGPLSPFDALVRSGDPDAVADALARVDGVRSAAAPAEWRRGGTALVTVIPTEDGNSPAGRETLDRIRAATQTLPAR